jgi:predicted CoA-binding protein
MSTFENPSDAAVAALLRNVKTIAVVGLSSDPERPSYAVAKALQKAGFRIIPIRPGGGEILGEPVAASLAEVADQVDLVDVFRAPEHVPGIIDEVLALGLKAVWLQDGVIHEAAAARAVAAGVTVVMDRCIKRDGLPLLELTAS